MEPIRPEQCEQNIHSVKVTFEDTGEILLLTKRVGRSSGSSIALRQQLQTSSGRSVCRIARLRTLARRWNGLS